MKPSNPKCNPDPSFHFFIFFFVAARSPILVSGSDVFVTLGRSAWPILGKGTDMGTDGLCYHIEFHSGRLLFPIPSGLEVGSRPGMGL